ncbi:MAG: extracellular solute-binding protein [Lachnospiraceae bacterium]
MKKALALVLSSVMALTALVGCGSSSTTEVTTEAAAETKPVSTEAATANAEPVTLTYWSMWTAEEAQGIAIQAGVDKYMAETGNTVNIEWKGRDIKTLIQAALDSKTEIDIFDEDYMNIATKYATQCLDMEDMAKAIDYDSYAISVLPQTVRELAGSLKCIPYQPYTSGIFYDKAAFEKANITAEPATWTEFLDVCEKLKAAGYVPLAQDDAYVNYTLGFLLARYIGEDGIKEVIQNGDWAENPSVLKAVEDIANLQAKGYLSETAPDTFPEGQNEIGFGTAAMIVNASWVPQEITNNTQCDIQWGMFNFPAVEGGKDPATVANIGAQAFAIPDYSAHPQEAFDLIAYLTSGETDKNIADGSKGIPADTRNTEWPAIIAGCQEPFNALTGVYEWDCGLDTDADISATITDNIKKVFEGKQDAKSFVAAMEAAGTPKAK